MANTTNFGWETPDDTDLVKDGALAMRTLGNAIDASLVDLKGGTTNQVLAKNSNTDMDFKWVETDDTNAIQNAIVDAKGDLIAASAADTPARLAVGNNGDTLVADSSTSTGLRWQGSQAAAKNAVINGGMDIWQRGTSSTSQGYVTADRWYMTGATTTWSQETSDLPTGFRYALKCTMTGTAQPQPILTIETNDSIRFAGQTVVLSYYVKTSNSTNAVIRLDSSNNVDESVTGTYTTIGTNSASTTTSWTRVSSTFAVPSTSKTLRVVVGANGNLTSGQTILITGVQLEFGSVATTFTRAGGTLAGELAACQRYYVRYNSQSTGHRIGNGFNSSTTRSIVPLYMPVALRGNPSVTASSAADFTLQHGATPTNTTVSAVGFGNLTSNQLDLTFDVASGLTIGALSQVRAANNTGWIEFSAEL